MGGERSEGRGREAGMGVDAPAPSFPYTDGKKTCEPTKRRNRTEEGTSVMAS
jgi:hypothetical protein